MPGAKRRSTIKTLAVPALLLIVAVALLRASGGPPAADAIPGAAPPVIEDGPDARTVRNTEAQARLRVYDAATDDAIRVFPATALDSLTGARNTVQRASDVLAVRSPRDFTLAPVQADEPLIESIAESGRVQGGFGQVQVPANAFLGQLVNAGWIAPAKDDGVVFASGVRPELQRFDADGALLWTSKRPAPIQVAPPALVRSGGSVTTKFRELQHAIARGPDDRFYILAGANGDSVRLDVLDDDGVFQRTAWIARDRDVFVDGHGRVAVVAPGGSLRGGEAREAFHRFDLESLGGRERVRLADHAGKVVVVNVWASWCAPCRHEMPALDRLAARLDTSEVVVIGLNEDVDVGAARAFVESIGGVRYTLAHGGGKLQRSIGYRGLPYTAVLDRAHGIAKVIHGFGDDLDDLERAIDAALDESQARQQ